MWNGNDMLQFSIYLLARQLQKGKHIILNVCGGRPVVWKLKRSGITRRGRKKCIKNVIDEVKAAWRDKKGIQNYIDFAALTLNVDIINMYSVYVGLILAFCVYGWKDLLLLSGKMSMVIRGNGGLCLLIPVS